MYSFEGKTVLITGATAGLGKALAEHYAASGANILIHGRNAEKGKELEAEIKEISTSGNVQYFNADFASLPTVKTMAGQILKQHTALDILINNAGIGGNKNDKREESADEIELRLAVNYIAPYLLTQLLVPLLTKASPSLIMNIGSSAQQTINFNDLMLKNEYTGLGAYTQSKSALIMHTIQLAEELKDTGILVNCVHPASLMKTKMVMDYFGYAKSTVEDGLEAVVNAVDQSLNSGLTGIFFDRKNESRAFEQAYDPEARNILRQLTQSIIKEKT